DDLGFSDLGCYGGEIRTPHLDALAAEGVRFTQFYNGSRCSPSRASLLTGLYPHQAGLEKNGKSLSTDAVTLPEVLQLNGYHTGMTGKWHLSQTVFLGGKAYAPQHIDWLSHQVQHSPFGKLESYPSNRGFDEHFGVIWGVVDYFDPFSLVHNEEPITEVPEDFYLTDFISDQTVSLIDDFSKDEDPFFLYVAYTAPHWPLHAKPEDIARYQGYYDEGWDALRRQRYERQMAMGLFDPVTTPLAPNESGKAWEDCNDKVWEADHMEVHAAMVDCMDQGIGRIIDQLKKVGEYENTIIIFLADNGASPERGGKPGYDRPATTRSGDTILYSSDHYDRPGSERTFGYLGAPWAGALNTPFRYWKAKSYEGGMCTPMIVHWPKGELSDKGGLIRQSGHVMDIMPTCLELAQAKHPDTYKGKDVHDMEGVSLVTLLKGGSWVGHEFLGFDHARSSAGRMGDWKISAAKNQNWELFNLKENRTETYDLSEKYPEKKAELIGKWQEWMERMKHYYE
ncbi:MAG: arylsulfatase, partial [Bacteroidota bacterium]